MSVHHDMFKSQLGLIVQLLDKNFKSYFIAKPQLEHSIPYLERNILHAYFYSPSSKLEMYNDILYIQKNYKRELIQDAVTILELKLENSAISYESLKSLALLDDKKEKIDEVMKKLKTEDIQLLKDFFKNN